MDDDLLSLTREQLIEEVKRLRAGIRKHRDSSGHDLCWYHPALWSLLPEAGNAEVAVPPWPQFLRGCIAYRSSLDRELPDAPVEAREFAVDDPLGSRVIARQQAPAFVAAFDAGNRDHAAGWIDVA